ncbi:MAG: efflux RND transporter periplasmic adaptor subunit [Phycisphaerales bacterium]|nr:efflux RND transporter periplasmic adaptor subunit [Phycisphaerales bacterium]
MDLTETKTGGQQHQPGVVRKITGLINDLALRSESAASFYKRSAAAIVQGFQSPYGAVSARFGAEVVEDYWHTGTTDPNFWKKPVQNMMDASMRDAQPMAQRFSSRNAELQIALISVILRDVSGSMIGVLTIVVRCTAEHPASMYRELLESFAAQLAIGASRIEAASRAPAAAAPDASMSKAANYTSGVEMAFALVSSLRTKLGCEMAAIGTADGPRVKIQAVSGFDEVSERGEAARLMSDAMGEAIDRGQTIVYQPASRDAVAPDEGYRIHKRWHDKLGSSCLASIPIEAGDDTTMVVSLRRRPELPFNTQELATIETLMQPYAPAFGLVERANRSLVSHVKRSASTSMREWMAPRGWGRKVAALCTMVALAWVCFGKLDYTISAPAVVRPTEARHIGTPATGILLSVHALAGDTVKEGQILAIFDDSELQVQRSQLLSELRIAQINENRAISEGKGVEAELARAEQELTRSRLTEVDRQIAQAKVVAPYDGQILTGELRSRIGETMALGTPMFEIAKLDSWTVDVEMPQRSAPDLKAGRVGSFAPNARPEEVSTLQLTRVQPVARPVSGKTVYITEAQLQDVHDWMKPGMEGMARVSFGRRPVWWVATHRLADYFRTNFWL